MEDKRVNPEFVVGKIKIKELLSGLYKERKKKELI